MESLVGVPNSHLLVHLARSLAGVLISLIARVSNECPQQLESFRRALVPLYQVVGDFLGRTPYDQTLPSNSSSHSLILRDAPPFRTLPSMGPSHHQTDDFRPRITGSHDATVNSRLVNDDDEDIRPPLTPPGGGPWSHRNVGSPIGYTSTPLHRTPARPRPRQPEQFALINQLLTAMSTSEDGGGITHATDQFANDPIFRHRLLAELDQLRALVDRGSDQRRPASPTVAALMGRIERAEITLSTLVHNLEHLHNVTMSHTDE
ncbi:uncharacterized protein LOC126577040 [Anopheles aquasalis]|uniref:uncharacterized protein LOC126577040 n=1 Tax=Anopheles aquasalis TaxID=42839 RepID=UPI00215B24F2|nr:uncharacterized protein LOC126577040 [Anopheles aquasalis]